MKTNPLFILALLCTLVQGAWAQTCVSSDDELRAAITNDGANITVTADINLSNGTLKGGCGRQVCGMRYGNSRFTDGR